MRQASWLEYVHFNSFNTQTKLNTASQAAPFSESAANFHTFLLTLPSVVEASRSHLNVMQTHFAIFFRTQPASPYHGTGPSQRLAKLTCARGAANMQKASCGEAKWVYFLLNLLPHAFGKTGDGDWKQWLQGRMALEMSHKLPLGHYRVAD